MFKIGEFSKISRVPVKTLRYYDELGLLKPVSVDRFSGYRFYAMHQSERLNRILALKDLGLTLGQIGTLLDNDLPEIEAASIVHHGPFNRLYEAYNAVFKWIEENGYQVDGPEREIYLETGSGPLRQDDPSYVTEVQIPVKRK